MPHALIYDHGQKGVHGGNPKESAEWPSVRSNNCEEEAGCCRTSAAHQNNVQSICYGVSRHIKVRLNGPDLQWSGKDQRRLLPRRLPITASLARDAKCVGRVLHLPTRQRPCTPGTRHCTTSGAGNTSFQAFIPPDLWPPNSPDLNPVDYKICIVCCTFGPSRNWQCNWRVA